MKHIIVLAALLSACAWGQQPQPQPPIKCDKYQHLVPAHTEDCSTNLIGCFRDVPDRCADDMHQVTEREWQALMARLKAVELELVLAKMKAQEAKKP